jgi:hypothetical protein
MAAYHQNALDSGEMGHGPVKMKVKASADSFRSVTSESKSKLLQIQAHALRESELGMIWILSSVEMCRDDCFRNGTRLQSVTFDVRLRFGQMNQKAFTVSPVLPSKRCGVGERCLPLDRQWSMSNARLKRHGLTTLHSVRQHTGRPYDATVTFLSAADLCHSAILMLLLLEGEFKA